MPRISMYGAENFTGAFLVANMSEVMVVDYK